MITTEKELLSYISSQGKLDAIVVEGYDGVGKGRVLNMLSVFYSKIPYRPDYNLWQKHGLEQPDRWKISGFFWDIYSHFMKNSERTDSLMLFDRGVISGAVYNHDYSIARDYKKMIGDMKILHILVTCSKEDYLKFAELRDSVDSTQYDICQIYTSEYMKCLEMSGVDYVVYNNIYDEELAGEVKETCAGCGHYSYGWCRHPEVNSIVASSTIRCELSQESEVQDIGSKSVQCV